jgi:tetraacyldisaccharide 4'-kinase
MSRLATRVRLVTPGVARWWGDIASGRRAASGASALAFALLVFLSIPYGVVSAVVQWVRSLEPARLGVPVISVGNLVVGGTGKTPLTIFLARRLAKRGRNVAIVSRGYGRLSREVVVVSDGGRPLVGWEEAGDEPVLAAMVTRGVSVVVGSDRTRAARYAVDKLGADAILVDDGFQHVKLHRALDVLTVDASRPVGNGHLIPGGTLREHPLGVGRADVIVVTRCRDGTRTIERTIVPLVPEASLVATRMRPAEFWDVGTGDAVQLSELKSGGCLALSSIADPWDFERTLEELGVEVSAALAFPDHHRYTELDHALVIDELRASGARAIVTTEKDAVRLSAWRPPVPLIALGIEVEITEGAAELDRALDAALSGGGDDGAKRVRGHDER